MKKYLLMRDDKEPGSCSSGKIIALQPLDLMTNEEGSTNRPYPVERNKIQKATEKTEKECNSTFPLFLLLPFIPSKQKLLSGVSTGVVNSRVPAITSQAAEELKESPNTFQENRNPFSENFPGKRGLSAAVIFFGLMLSGFLVKLLAGGWAERALTNEYRVMPLPIRVLKEKMADKYYQDALVRITVPPVAKEKKNHLKPAKLKDIRKQVGVKGNEYTVGYFGGISGLKLTVSNGSEHFINRVEVEINYLERNGAIIETDTYQIRAMKPHSFQTLSVPPTKKGAKVTYKIMNIYSRQYRPLLKEI
jgi:hypothetical protein